MEIANYIEIMDTLKTKQMILQGPPGTSKTYMAKKIIAEKLGWKYNSEDTDDEQKQIQKYLEEKVNRKRWEMVQFHPSYGYEDFVRGITVETNKKKQIVYKTVNKVFGEICERAAKGLKDVRKEAPKKKPEDIPYFLIIDEINRADVATVFGELIYALEYRGEEITIPYKLDQTMDGRKLTVPENLYIIATMNTADKSVGNIDYAIRRRFVFFDCPPSGEVLRGYYGLKKGQEDNESVKLFWGVNKFISECLKSEYRKIDFEIGHTYFMVKTKESKDREREQKYKFQYQVLPIMREYYIDGILNASLVRDKKSEGEGASKLINYLSGKDELDDEKLNSIMEYLSGKETSEGASE